MIIQQRKNTSRLIQQHHHAILCGEWANQWREQLPLETQMAIALHDYAWVESDRMLLDGASRLFHREAGQPYDFVSMPPARRVSLYREGITAAAAIHPWVGALVSAHYASFITDSVDEEFRKLEARRQKHLRARIRPGLKGRFDQDLQILQFLDYVSLFACMRPPDSDPERWPTWLRSETSLGDETISLRWEEGNVNTLVLEPSPFQTPNGPIPSQIEYVDLPDCHWHDLRSFQDCFERAAPGVWRFRIT